MKILWLDDEFVDNAFKYMLTTLLSSKGFGIDTLTSSAEAYKLPIDELKKYDLIILDFILKNGTSLGLIDYFKNISNAYIIMVTNFADCEKSNSIARTYNIKIYSKTKMDKLFDVLKTIELAITTNQTDISKYLDENFLG